MNAKWIGAIFVFLSCGGFGFRIAHGYRYREQQLQQLMSSLEIMASELEYRLTPLSELFQNAAANTSGALREVFKNMAREVNCQAEPDAGNCMRAALEKSDNLPACLRRSLNFLGQTLGQFDLSGQLRGLESTRNMCRREIARLERDRDARLRSYQTLGLCAGAALVILFA